MHHKFLNHLFMEVIKFIQIEPNELKSLLKESVKQEFNQLKEEILCKTPLSTLHENR